MSQNVEETVKKRRISPDNPADSTSRVPDDLLHSILIYLKSEDLFHTRLVSKRWHHSTPSYFPLEFDEPAFIENIPDTSFEGMLISHSEFLKWISSSLHTYGSKLAEAEKRVLRLKFSRHESINGLMRVMDALNFHEVYVEFGSNNYLIPYIFQSKYLRVLHLTLGGISGYLFDGVETFASLQELQLDRVNIDGETLSVVISKCPNIRELKLLNCKLLKCIVIAEVDRLKKLYVQMSDSYPRSRLTHIQVIAPSLEVFHFVHYNPNKAAVKMNISACRLLREFHLDCTVFPDGLDHEHFCSDFPHLETLLVGPCEALKRVKISSTSLRNLTFMFTQLHNYNYSRKSVVSAPNLCSFHYVGKTFKSSLAPSDTPTLLETTDVSLVPQFEMINRAWFLQLRSHLKKISNRVALGLVIRDQTSLSELSLRGHRLWSLPSGRTPTQLLPHIEQLKLDIRLKDPLKFHGCLLKYIIDNLLWMSHPNALTLIMPDSFTALALGVCNELLTSRREGNCCVDTQNKCWRHFLNDFMVREVDTEKDKPKEFNYLFTWQLC